MNVSSILIMCALPQEKEALTSELKGDATDVVISETFGLKALKYQYGEHQIFVKETGMGNVNAGIGLAMILEKIDMDQVILIGVGGALRSDLKIGDMIISDAVLQHDYLSSLDFGDCRMQPGALILSPEDNAAHDPIIQSTPLKIKLDLSENSDILRGLVLSGSEFVGTTKRKNELAKLHKDAMLVDMEASAIGYVANKAGIPFIIAKTVSDRLLPDGSIESDFTLFLEEASKNAAMVTLKLLESLD